MDSGNDPYRIEQNFYVFNNTINIERIEMGSSQMKGSTLPSIVRKSLPKNLRSGSKDMTDEEAAKETLTDYMKRIVQETKDLVRPIGLTKIERQ